MQVTGYLYSLRDSVLRRVTGQRLMAWVMRQEYLLASYASTTAINPSGNAIAKDIKAASSPSLASASPSTWKSGSNFNLQLEANSRRLRGSPPPFGDSIMLRKSEKPVKDVMKAWACIPLTGMLYSFPARTLLVPSKPPVIFLVNV